jgi:hypothetical protein
VEPNRRAALARIWLRREDGQAVQIEVVVWLRQVQQPPRPCAFAGGVEWGGGEETVQTARRARQQMGSDQSEIMH